MKPLLEVGLPLFAAAGLAAGGFLALGVAPAERDMGDVYRILYVHVPAAWMALLAVTVTFASSIVYLWKSSFKADALAAASAEVGVFFGALLIVLGSIWARPTWGVWWDWDPRLTTAAIMLFAFAGYLALRRLVEDPERRATWAAITAIVAYVDVPILWLSVRWWRSLHQVQSTTDTIHSVMTKSLLVNTVAFLILMSWFLRLRYRIARQAQKRELAEPPLEAPSTHATAREAP